MAEKKTLGKGSGEGLVAIMPRTAWSLVSCVTLAAEEQIEI